MPPIKRDDGDAEKEDGSSVQIGSVEDADQDILLPKTCIQHLSVFNGTFNDENILKLVASPFVACTNIAALWVVLIASLIMSFYVAQGYVVAQLFSPPPYSLSPASVGYLPITPFIGGSVGSLLVGAILDPLTVWLTRKNRGVYAPEFRLVSSIIGVLSGVGLFDFGALSERHGNIYAIDFMWGLMIFGTAFVMEPCWTYAIEAFQGMSNEIFIANVMVKNLLFFAYSYFINDWTASTGPGMPFYILEAIAIGIVFTGIPVYVFGKKYRWFWQNHDVMAKLNLKED